MAERVQVAVKSRSRFGGQEDVLSFRGQGVLTKTAEGWHLRYEAANEVDGSAIVSEIRLETATRRAVLLDPKTPTATRIDGGDGGALMLNVATKEVAWQLSRRGQGFITLAYTLLLGVQPLSALQVELTLTKEEN